MKSITHLLHYIYAKPPRAWKVTLHCQMIPFLAASNGGTPVPVVSSAMYQVNPAAPSAGGYDGYNANAQLK